MNNIDFNVLENKENAHILLSYSMYLDKLIIEAIENNNVFELCVSLTELYNSVSNSFDIDSQLVIKSKMELCYAAELFINKIVYQNMCKTKEELVRSINYISNNIISTIERHITLSVILLYITNYKSHLKSDYITTLSTCN